MPKIEMEITDAQMKQIKEDVRAQMEHDFNHEKLMEFLKQTNSISFQEYIYKYGIGDRVDALKERQVKSLSDHEKLLLATYWMMCTRLG